MLALLVVVVFWANPWGGASPGSRYFAPAIPLLALPLAHMWMRARLLSVGVSVVGVLTMFLAVSTEPLVPVDGTGGLGEWARLFIAGDVAPSLFGAGRWFAVVCALIGSTVASMILRSLDTGGNDLAVGGSR